MSGPSHAIPPLLRRSPRFTWYNSLFLATPVPPPLLQLAINADATTRGPRHLSQPHLLLLYQPSHVWSAYRFPSLLFVCTTRPTTDARQRVYAYLITYPDTPKSCAAAFLSVSFVFVTPKVSSIPSDSWFIYPFLGGVGVVHLILYHGGVGCGSGLYSCFDFSNGPSVRVLPFCHGTRKGARLWRVCMCMYCTGSCIQLEAFCTCLSNSSTHGRTIVLIHGAWVDRSYVFNQKKGSGRLREVYSLWDGPNEIHHEGTSPVCPGSWVGLETFTFQDWRRLGNRPGWTCGVRGVWHGF